MANCIFCAIVAGRLPANIVHEDSVVLAFLDIHPFALGHTLVIPRQHLPFLEDLDEATATHLFAVTRGVAAALRHADLKGDGVNLFLSDGEAAGQEVFHLHVHIFPRFAGDPLGPGRPFGRSPAKAHETELNAIAGRLSRAYASLEHRP